MLLSRIGNVYVICVLRCWQFLLICVLGCWLVCSWSLPCCYRKNALCNARNCYR